MLYDKYTKLLGMAPIQTVSVYQPTTVQELQGSFPPGKAYHELTPEEQQKVRASKSPSPADMQRAGELPKRRCPTCGERTLIIYGLCPTCAEAEDGKYRTKFICEKCQYVEKSEKPISAWLEELGYNFDERWKTKRELGIKTVTDEGIKE